MANLMLEQIWEDAYFEQLQFQTSEPCYGVKTPLKGSNASRGSWLHASCSLVSSLVVNGFKKPSVPKFWKKQTSKSSCRPLLLLSFAAS